MSSRRAFGAAVAGAAALALTAAAAGHAGPPALPGDAVGCHPSWPVSVYDGAGQPATTATRVVPCVTETGFATSETSIGVTNDGALFFSPAGTENSMAISRDHGASWSLTAPTHAERTALWNTVDPQITVDRRTGRLFWVHVTGPTRTLPIVVDQSPLPPPEGTDLGTAVAFAYGFQVYATPDDGKTWTTADYRTAPVTDWEKIVVGPPAAGAPQPHGSPNVVYVCGNSPDEAVGPGRLCYRSLDGGTSFAPAGFVYPSVATPKACIAVDADTGAVGSDGTLYQPMSCTDGAYVAVSHDEGASYTWHPVAGAPGTTSVAGGRTEIALDADNDLYAVWLSNGRIEMSMSRDGARTWTAAQTVSPPQLHQIALPAVAAGPAGSMGVAYYASDPTSGPMAGYLTQTTDALAARPTFVTAALEQPGHVDAYATGLASGSPRADYVGATYDGDGVLWAGMMRQLGAPDPTGQVKTVGVVGRVAPLGAPPAAQAPAKRSTRSRAPSIARPAGTLAATGRDLGLGGAVALALLAAGVALHRRRVP